MALAMRCMPGTVTKRTTSTAPRTAKPSALRPGRQAQQKQREHGAAIVKATQQQKKEKVQRQERWGSEDGRAGKHMAGTLAALVAASLLSGAFVPEEALAARSGGRVGGSNFSARRAAPAPAPRSAPGGTSVRSYNYYTAPPVVGGYGYGGYGGYGGMSPFGGFSIMPSIFMPMGGLGGILRIFVFVMVLSAVANVISSFVRRGSNKSDRDDYDDL